MLITVDIGNTNINLSVFSLEDLNSSNIDSKLKEASKVGNFQISALDIKSSDEYSLIIYNILKINNLDLSLIKGVIISSVVPELTPVIYKAMKKISTAYIYTVGAGLKTGININIDTSTELGSDIVANAVAGTCLYSYPLVIIDFGTATTVTFIDENKNICGVSIMPGVMLSLNSLAKNTALLGHISIENSKNKLSILGKNSSNSIKSGVINGFAFAVDGFINKIKTDYNLTTLHAVATGDYSSHITKYCSNKITENQDLTALGLLKLYILNRKKL